VEKNGNDINEYKNEILNEKGKGCADDDELDLDKM
jgi:hypothetical protein